MVDGGDIPWEQIVTKLVSEFEQESSAVGSSLRPDASDDSSSALSAVPIAAAYDKMVPAIYINHVSYQVTDYAKTRDFYAGLSGMKVRRRRPAKTQCRCCLATTFSRFVTPARARTRKLGVDHIAYTIADWDAERTPI